MTVARCGASYVGEAERHYFNAFRRIQEHLGLIKGASFSGVILDNDSSMFKRRIMEAIYIGDMDPIVNRPFKSYKSNLI